LVQLETHRRFCCCKKGEAPKSKPRYVNLLAWIFPCLCNLFSGVNLYTLFTHFHRAKHPVKVLSGQQSASREHLAYVYSRELWLRKFMSTSLSGRCCPSYMMSSRMAMFMQDNDPKHVSKLAKEFQFLRTHNVNWLRR